MYVNDPTLPTLPEFMTPSKTLSLFVLLALVLAAVWLALVWQWPWADLLRDPDALPIAEAAVQMAVLPEIAAAFFAGGLLALASTALQQVVHNPLASDSTLAVAGGAQLALMLVTLFFPAAGLFGSFWVAFAGAVAAMLLVLLVAGAGGANALALILAGLLANMVFAAIAAVISQFYSDLLLGIMVWGAGSLLQDGWATVAALAWTTLAAAVAFALLHRPLTLLALDDEQARRLGAPVGLLRLLVLLLAAGVTAQVVSRLGVISFAGLAGASVAHLLRVRAMGARFALSFLAGGLLLAARAGWRWRTPSSGQSPRRWRCASPRPARHNRPSAGWRWAARWRPCSACRWDASSARPLAGARPSP